MVYTIMNQLILVLVVKMKFNMNISYGYCNCGCGKKTKTSIHNSKRDNLIKGEPQRFIFNHDKRNKKFNIAEKNGMWKGNNVGQGSLHEWIINRKPKPQFCESCKINPPYDLANISGEYKRNIDDFEWLCRSCHMEKDGRLEKLISRNKIERR